MLRKIRDLPPPCLHSEHNPPMNVVLEPGEYEWECPGCGEKTRFIIPYITCGHNSSTWKGQNER